MNKSYTITPLISFKSWCNIYVLFSWLPPVTWPSCGISIPSVTVFNDVEGEVLKTVPPTSHKIWFRCDFFFFFSSTFCRDKQGICQADSKSRPCDQTAASAFLPYFPTNWIFGDTLPQPFLCSTATSHRREDAWLMCISNLGYQEILTQSRCGSGPLFTSCDSLQA